MAKVDLFPEFKELFKSLNANKVKYLLVGGYAVIYHGYSRTTGDIDVWIAISPSNAQKVSKVLQEWGDFPASSVKPELFNRSGQVFIIGRVPRRVDIMTSPSGVQFDECYKHREIVLMDGIRVPLISLDDLKVNKRASGRNKDLADLANLPATPPKPVKRRNAK